MDDLIAELAARQVGLVTWQQVVHEREALVARLAPSLIRLGVVEQK